ncbi:MAG: carbon monoxide dehydrogenase subunit G [Rhodoferax sp.]|jgi:carbon monoxide dehydrogenase subunit G|nr:carbon monoxide dehydrogenase subunit G [Rhodoferax sp.]
MDMQASRQLAVTQQQAWDALNDPEVLKLCIPGCDKVEATEPLNYVVGVAVKIGPVSAKFSGKIRLGDMNPPSSYTLTFDGQGGAAGFGKGSAKVVLTPNDAGCELGYTVHAQVGGKVAQLGQRLVDGAAKSMAEDFFKRFDDEMQRRYPPAAVPDAAAAAAAPAEAAAPGASAIPMWAWVGGAVVLALVVWMLR